MNINEELRRLIPKLKDDEFSSLEKSIIAEGCRDALVTWSGTLIDGHNRYEICTKHGIEFEAIEKNFNTLDDVKIWMIENQAGRRNITDYQRYELMQVKAEILRERGRDNMSDAGKGLSLNDNPSHNTQKAISEGLGWSTGKVAQADVVSKKATEDVKQKLRDGDLSIGRAYREVKKAERTKEIKQERQAIAEKGEHAKPTELWRIFHGDINNWQADRQYDFIITDPPYPKEFLPLWEVLAERAKEWLKPGGLLIAMSGQMYLDQVYAMLSKHMTYYWTASYYTPGQPTPLRHVNVNTTWKPLLIYRNGDYKGKIFGDVYKSDGNDKGYHKWGQSISGMSDIIQKMVLPGQSILDPFCGAGTTGIAAVENKCFFDGVELDIENVNISKGRLSE